MAGAEANSPQTPKGPPTIMDGPFLADVTVGDQAVTASAG